MDRENPLKSFISYLEQNRNHSFSSDEWNELKKKYPLDSQDKEYYKKLIKSHLDNAGHHREMDRLEEAIDEMDRALVLAPMDWENRYQLAMMYASYYENQSHSAVHMKKALKHLNRLEATPCPKVQINNLKTSLNKVSRIIDPPERTRKGALFLLLPLLIALLLGIINQREYLIEQIKRWMAPKITETEVVSPPPRPVYGTRALATYGFDDPQLDFQLVESEILNLNGHDAYSLQARITHGQSTLQSADLQLRFLNEDSTLLMEKSLTLPQGYQPAAAPGETLVLDHFDYLKILPQDIDRISITLKDIQLTPPLIRRDEPVDLGWATERPDSVNIQIKWGEMRNLEAYDRYYYMGDMVLENRGTSSISHLELELQGFSHGLSPNLREMLTPVNRHSLELQPGEKRPFQVVLTVNHEDLQPQQGWYIQIKDVEQSNLP